MMGFIDRCNDYVIKRAVKSTANKLKKLDTRDYVTAAEYIANNIYVEFSDARRERLFAYHIDIEGKVIERQLVSVGTIDTSSVYIREIARQALLLDASGVILAHTHIASDHEPSSGDIHATEALMLAMDTLGMCVYDHIIVSKSGYYSFKEEGKLYEDEE